MAGMIFIYCIVPTNVRKTVADALFYNKELGMSYFHFIIKKPNGDITSTPTSLEDLFGEHLNHVEVGDQIIIRNGHTVYNQRDIKKFVLFDQSNVSNNPKYLIQDVMVKFLNDDSTDIIIKIESFLRYVEGNLVVTSKLFETGRRFNNTMIKIKSDTISFESLE